jgi:hypothetical protein
MPAKSNKSAADKLAEREGDGTRTGSKSKAKPAAKAADKPKPGPSRETLIQAAKLRAEGATWDAIRTATGCRLGSSGWFKHWEREGIEHIPAGQRVKPKAEPPKASPSAEAADSNGLTAEQRKRGARTSRGNKRSGEASGPRTSDGKRHRVVTRTTAPAKVAA